MSDADDRMERAERIREMRQSRERPDEGADSDPANDENEPDAADEADGNTTEELDTAGDSADGVETESEVTAADGVAMGDEDTPEGSPDATPTAATTAGAAATDPDESGNGQVPSVDNGDASGDPADSGPGIAPLGGASGFSPSDADGSDDADDGDDGAPSTRGAARAGTATAAAAESSVRVLEFVVGDQTYCTDIERVEEIVKREAITRVPNTHDAVEGVVDLRGQITTILDAKQLLGVEARGRESLLVIFSPDAFEEHGTVGWIVDEVRQVVPVAESQVRTASGDDDHVRGIVDREGAEDLTVWIRPGVTMSRAVDGAGLDTGPTE